MCGSSLKVVLEDDEAAAVGNVVGKSWEFRGLLPALLAEATSERAVGRRAGVLSRARRREAPRDADRRAEIELVAVALGDRVHQRTKQVERLFQRVRHAAAERQVVLADDLIVVDELLGCEQRARDSRPVEVDPSVRNLPG